MLQMTEPLIDSELVHLAQCYSPTDLRTIAMKYMGFDQPKLDTIWAEKVNHLEGFKTDVLVKWRNKSAPGERQVCFKKSVNLRWVKKGKCYRMNC